jgi:hypothetical protein
MLSSRELNGLGAPPPSWRSRRSCSALRAVDVSLMLTRSRFFLRHAAQARAVDRLAVRRPFPLPSPLARLCGEHGSGAGGLAQPADRARHLRGRAQLARWPCSRRRAGSGRMTSGSGPCEPASCTHPSGHRQVGARFGVLPLFAHFLGVGDSIGRCWPRDEPVPRHPRQKRS